MLHCDRECNAARDARPGGDPARRRRSLHDRGFRHCRRRHLAAPDAPRGGGGAGQGGSQQGDLHLLRGPAERRFQEPVLPHPGHPACGGRQGGRGSADQAPRGICGGQRHQFLPAGLPLFFRRPLCLLHGHALALQAPLHHLHRHPLHAGHGHREGQAAHSALPMSNRRPTPTHTPPQATGTEKAKFKEQAARDFESILLSRARELRPGGHLVIANFAEDPRGWWLGKTDIGPGMYDTMDRLWRGMAEEGLISKEEYERTTFCNHYRTEEEAVGAFAEGGAVHNAGLRLLHHSFVVTPCPFREAYRANKGDPAAHAKWMIPTFRTWSNSTFESALDSSRSPDQRRALSDELFKRMEAEAAKDPENFGMDYVHSFMLIKKVQE